MGGEGEVWYLVGSISLAAALLGAYIYADSLGHGFRMSATFVVSVALLSVFGIAAIVSGFIRDVVLGYRGHQRSNGNQVLPGFRATSRADHPTPFADSTLL